MIKDLLYSIETFVINTFHLIVFFYFYMLKQHGIMFLISNLYLCDKLMLFPLFGYIFTLLNIILIIYSEYIIIKNKVNNI